MKEERIYLGSFEIYRKFESSSLKVERQTVHVSDDSGRIAMLEKRTVGSSGDDNGTDALLTRYIYSNHLQSASLELDEDGKIINYEEYHPYGTTSYQAINASIKAVAKRYRYTGKERDEESGLYYHGARYYIVWLGRWASPDPINSENYNLQKGYGLEKNRERDFLELCASPYEYSYDNPINYNDETGEQPNKKKPINTPKAPPPIDAALEGSPQYQESKPEKPKEKTPLNVIITIPNTKKERDTYNPIDGIAKSGWNFITANSMSEAYEKLYTLTSQKGKVDNLIINTHGSIDSPGYMVLSGKDYKTGKTFIEGGWGIDLEMLQKYKKDNNIYGAEVAKQIRALDKIGNLMNTDGVCVLTSCLLAKGSEGKSFLKAIGNLWENKGTIYASGSFNSEPFYVRQMIDEGKEKTVVTLYTQPLIYFGNETSYKNTQGNGFVKLIKGKIIDFGNTNGNIKLNEKGINETK